jgi:hypothetical protein
MKSNGTRTKLMRAKLTCTFVVTAFALAGCATRGYMKSETAAASLHRAAGEVQAQSRALDVTLASLNELISKPPADLKFQYEVFNSNLAQLNAAARRNDTLLRRVGEKNAAYFESWDKDMAAMNYEAVRERSMERKNEVVANFDSVYRRYQEVQETVHPLLAYFEDIRKALGTDLTVGGLEAMKSTVSNVNENAVKVQTALVKLADDLAASGTRMSSITAQAQP